MKQLETEQSAGKDRELAAPDQDLVISSGVLWPTPTLAVTVTAPSRINAALAQIILEEERKVLRNSKSVPVAGIADGLTAHWLSYNVLNWQYPEIAEFRKLVLDGVAEWIRLIGDPQDPGLKIKGISCWANVLRHGERLAIHHHDPALVSGHYTVQDGNDASVPERVLDSGSTVYFRPGFMDRSHGGDAAMAASPWDANWQIVSPPIPGRFFLFPSFVRHEVRPYLGSTERISIALDVFVAKQQLLIHFGGPRWFVPR